VFDKTKSALAILDKVGKIQLVYTSPVLRLPSNKTSTPELDWDPSVASLSFPLPDTFSFPLVIAFGVGPKIPEVKGGFGFSFPSFKLGAKGEIETSDSDSDDEKKGGFGLGLKMPKFGKDQIETTLKIKVFHTPSVCLCLLKAHHQPSSTSQNLQPSSQASSSLTHGRNRCMAPLMLLV
jgi:hypothetical protein